MVCGGGGCSCSCGWAYLEDILRHTVSTPGNYSVHFGCGGGAVAAAVAVAVAIVIPTPLRLQRRYIRPSRYVCWHVPWGSDFI